MERDTQIVHAGFRKRTESGPFLAGPQFSSTYTSPGEPSDNALTYGRFHNPTWTAWEEALRVLEGGEAITFASGMAAVDAVLGTVLRPGDAVVLAADCYYTVRRLAAGWFEKIGVDVRLVPTRDNAQEAALEGAKLVWTETPTNPQLDVCDIAAMVTAARARGVLVAVDHTTARRDVPAVVDDGSRGDELRWCALDGGAARPVGGRCDQRRVHPLQRRMRGGCRYHRRRDGGTGACALM